MASGAAAARRDQPRSTRHLDLTYEVPRFDLGLTYFTVGACTFTFTNERGCYIGASLEFARRRPNKFSVVLSGTAPI